MDDTDQDFMRLMQRMSEGSEEAARELLGRYGEHILRVVRRRLNKKLRSKFDSVDFVQSVWASFFAKSPQRHHFECPEALFAFLGRLARNKVADATRKRTQVQKYDVNRERSLDHSAVWQEAQRVTRQPTPSQVVGDKEQWDRIMQDLSPRERHVLSLLRGGSSCQEVADELGINEKTVRRLIRRVSPESKNES
jgi:RNA polymerase sigma factor (sigma-70 family)